MVSVWTSTPSSLSFKITGTIDGGGTIGTFQKIFLFIGPNNLPFDPSKGDLKLASVMSLGGSPTTLPSTLWPGNTGAYIFNDSEEDIVKIQIAKAGRAHC